MNYVEIQQYVENYDFNSIYDILVEIYRKMNIVLYDEFGLTFELNSLYRIENSNNTETGILALNVDGIVFNQSKYDSESDSYDLVGVLFDWFGGIHLELLICISNSNDSDEISRNGRKYSSQLEFRLKSELELNDVVVEFEMEDDEEEEDSWCEPFIEVTLTGKINGCEHSTRAEYSISEFQDIKEQLIYLDNFYNIEDDCDMIYPDLVIPKIPNNRCESLRIESIIEYDEYGNDEEIYLDYNENELKLIYNNIRSRW